MDARLEEVDGTYADRSATVTSRRAHSWIFELGRIVNLLIANGMRIESLREHDATCCAIVPTLTEGPDRMFRLPAGALSLPLSFSIRATRPA